MDRAVSIIMRREGCGRRGEHSNEFDYLLDAFGVLVCFTGDEKGARVHIIPWLSMRKKFHRQLLGGKN